VHGLFDSPKLRTAFLNGLRAEAGLVLFESAAASPDDDIDRLADHVEAHLDARLLERIVGLETS
jgi:cobyric acid synthase